MMIMVIRVLLFPAGLENGAGAYAVSFVVCCIHACGDAIDSGYIDGVLHPGVGVADVSYGINGEGTP